MYISYKYPTNQIWNCDEMGIQIGQTNETCIVAKRDTHNTYGYIFKSRKQIFVTVCVNTIGIVIQKNYIIRANKEQ